MFIYKVAVQLTSLDKETAFSRISQSAARGRELCEAFSTS